MHIRLQANVRGEGKDDPGISRIVSIDVKMFGDPVPQATGIEGHGDQAMLTGGDVFLGNCPTVHPHWKPRP